MMSGLPAIRAETYKFDASKLRSLRSKDRPRLTFSWVQTLQSRIESCWNRPKGLTSSDDIEIRIKFDLNPDGSIASGPTLVSATKQPLATAFAESALRAIKACAPYSSLPANEYKGGWDKLDMSFSTDSEAKRERDRLQLEKFRKAVRRRLQKPGSGSEPQ
jgi:hypothetical protein